MNISKASAVRKHQNALARVSCTIPFCRLSFHDLSWWDVLWGGEAGAFSAAVSTSDTSCVVCSVSITFGGDRPRNFSSRTDSCAPAQFLGCVYRRACTDIFFSQYGHLCWFSLGFRRPSLPDEAVDLVFFLTTDELGAISVVSEFGSMTDSGISSAPGSRHVGPTSTWTVASSASSVGRSIASSKFASTLYISYAAKSLIHILSSCSLFSNRKRQH